MIGSVQNLEVIDSKRRLVPSKLGSRFRDRALDWADRMSRRESLKAGWDIGTSRIVFYCMKNGEPQVYCEADLHDARSIQTAIKDARLGKERMIVKQTWRRWNNNQVQSMKRKYMEGRDQNEYKEIMSLLKYRQAIRDGGRKRTRSHLVEVNPLASK